MKYGALLLLLGLVSVTRAEEAIVDVNHDGTKEKADLPEGIQANDPGLKFIDLNGDGFDDLLFATADRVAIYVWMQHERNDLGWKRGWTQKVRDGKRTGAAGEPPPLEGADVRVDGEDLIVTRGGNETKLNRKALVAFEMPPPLSPEEALKAFRVRPGFRVEIVATEPVVIDPVAFDWGPDGRLWVVEMRDYPSGIDGKGKPGGVIKWLADADGDGRYEKAVVYLDGVPFPSGIMAWGDGILISSAPDIIYAQGTGNDGRAASTKVLFTGFRPGNQQHRFNGFEYGLDGWIYGANGDSGGTVTSTLTKQTLSISGRDVRFHPDTGEIETVSASSQFQRHRDDWGHWFGNANPTWLWQVTLPEHYLKRNPKLAVRGVKHELANYPDPTRVFAVSKPLDRPNQPWSLGHVTSACSPCPWRDESFGPEFASSVFISEPVHNTVHREVLTPDGAGFKSARAKGEEKSEFLASTDNWFRPTSIHTGPDGALYIADMYRFVIEHPEWISPEMQSRLDLRAGSDKGRIYRVVREGTTRRPVPNLAKMSDSELAVAMDSPSGWQRDMVQRLLAGQKVTAEAAGTLRGLLTVDHAPQVRVQSFATMGLLRTLTSPDIAAALGDPHPAVRIQALQQSERLFTDGSLFNAVAALAQDSDAEVRVQAAFTLGEWPAARAVPVLRELAEQYPGDEMLLTAVKSSLSPDDPLFASLNKRSSLPPAAIVPKLKPSSDDRAKVIAGYHNLDGVTGDAGRGHTLYTSLCATCHQFRGEGFAVGPDLGMVSNKPVDWLLAAVLDPNQAVEARYQAWTVTTKEGMTFAGLISAETSNNLTIRMPGGAEQPVLRSAIKSTATDKLSLMPAGFESALKPQDMADMLAWLREPAK
jgi:putative membrane-bound dehydrogenase-like protein